MRQFLGNMDSVFDTPMQFSGEELRGTRAPLPVDFMYYLNDIQRIMLSSLENFGWELAFIRRPLYMPPMVVMKNAEGNNYAILEDDGNVNMSPKIKIRTH